MPEAYLGPVGPPSSACPKKGVKRRMVMRRMASTAQTEYRVTLKPREPALTRNWLPWKKKKEIDR